jgi:2'-5' RNA ligase
MRTFIALELPQSIQAFVVTRQEALQDALSPDARKLLRWTPAAKAHLTLRFLGETDGAQCERLGAALSTAGASHGPLSLALEGAGCFPHCAKPSVLWLGLRGDLESLGALQAKVDTAAQSAGFAPEPRPFAPHLTIARVHRTGSAADRRQLGDEFRHAAPALPASPVFIATEFIHMQSQLKPAGAVYTPLARFQLTRIS